MGWTETHIHGTIREFFIKQFNTAPLAVSVVHRSEVYAAFPYRGAVTAVVWVFEYRPNSYHNLRYKDMDESCGPYQTNCPIHILNLLTPTDNDYAIEWRANCHHKIFRRRKKFFENIDQQFRYVTKGVKNVEEKTYLAPVVKDYLELKGFDKEAIFKKSVGVWGARIL